MSISMKYGRTYHYPFSPGTTSDDRINSEYWTDLGRLRQVIHTEKLDGENNCLNRYGIFARSHVAPTTSPWTRNLRERWELLKNDLGDLELFGENLYAVHSIEYRKLEHHYYVFAVRVFDRWLSWEEVQFYAAMFDFPTVPVLSDLRPAEETNYRHHIEGLAAHPSVFESIDVGSELSCTCEGVVTRNADEFTIEDFQRNVFKYVRKGHVKTDEHWTRNWKRAKLLWEFSSKI
jgi:hypothetical protein